MQFPIFLCNASMFCWKDSSGMNLDSIVTTLLMASMSSKRVPLSFGEKKNVPRSKIKGIGRLLRCSDVLFRSGTAGCSPHPVPLLFRHTRIFDDNLPNIVLFHAQLTSLHTTCPTHLTLTSVLLVKGLPLLE